MVRYCATCNRIFSKGSHKYSLCKECRYGRTPQTTQIVVEKQYTTPTNTYSIHTVEQPVYQSTNTVVTTSYPNSQTVSYLPPPPMPPPVIYQTLPLPQPTYIPPIAPPIYTYPPTY